MAATRGRELRLELVTDTRRFEADDAARDLDDLADAASDADRDLRDLDRQADRTGRSLHDLAEDADRAGDEIGESFDDAKGRVGQAGTEMASGFDGSMESITGAAQSAAAEIATMFGPAGAVAAGGVAVLAAMYSQHQANVEAAKERIQAMSESLRRARSDAAALGTSLREAFTASTTRDYFDGLDPDVIKTMRKDAQLLRQADPSITMQDLALAAQGSQDAIVKVGRATEDYNAAMQDAQGHYAQVRAGAKDLLPALDQLLPGQEALSRSTQDLNEEYLTAIGNEAARTEALGGLTDAMIDVNEAVKESADTIVTSSDDITQAMAAIPGGVLAASQAAADASGDLADTWADNVANVGAAADEIIAQQRADIDATKQYYADLETAYAAGGTDLVNYILNSESPADTAKLVAQMSPEDQAEVAANYAELGDLSSQALIKAQNAGLDKAATDAKTKGTAAGKAYSDGVAAGITANAGKISSAAKAANPGSGGSTGASYWANTSWANTSGKKVP